MIVSTESGGLGNRLKSWVSACRLDPAARVYWPLTDNMPARFDDLFANDCAIAAVPENATEYRSWRLAVTADDRSRLPAGFATAGGGPAPIRRRIGKLVWRLRGEPDDRYRYMITPKRFSGDAARSGRVVDFEYRRIPEHFRAIYVPLFAAVAIRADLVERADAWARAAFDSEMTGIQVRTWRDSPARRRKHHVPAIARLERLLERTDPSRRFFVVTDDDEIVPWLESRLGRSRVVAFARETERRSSYRSVPGMQEDLIDMLLLARADEIFASYLSTFSEAAWWLGGARASVEVF